MKKNKILYLIAFIVSVLTLVSVTFGWFVFTRTVGDMEFSILQIESQVVLYHAKDNNFNGVPEVSDTLNRYYNQVTEKYMSYGNPYYNEKYEFNYLDQRYSLVADSESNLLNQIVIDDVAPSKIYTYKFEIINYAACDNDVEFCFDANKLSSTVEDFEVRLGYVNTDSTIDFCDWKSLSNNKVDLNPKENMSVPAFSYGIDAAKLEVGRLDLWLQIRVKSNVVTPLNESFTLPYYRLTLCIPEN